VPRNTAGPDNKTINSVSQKRVSTKYVNLSIRFHMLYDHYVN